MRRRDHVTGAALLHGDQHDAALVNNVRPPGWRNPRPAARYDLVAIGAGTAGLVAAAGAAMLGARVALVERHLLGGDCLNTGCVPSKAMIRSARLLGDIARAGELGVQVPEGAITADFGAVMARMRRLRARVSAHDSVERMRALGVEVFFGDAQFTSGNAIAVDGAALSFKRALIATGSRPAVPAIEGLPEAGFLTNETVFSLTTLPRRLAVLGGGPMGCELGQAFRRLGAQVTLLHSDSRLLERDDADAAALVEGALRRDGVRLVLGATVTRAKADARGTTLQLEVEGHPEEVLVDAVLVAAGRAPNVESLNLASAGVDWTPKRGVLVNDRLQTTNRRIYAAGDVCLPYRLTHAAHFASRIVIENALFGRRRRFSALAVPWCTYTDPEVAHVGLSGREASEQGTAVETVVRPLADVDRAIVDGETEGFVKIHVGRRSDRILGATIVAPHAGEMLNEITLAMKHGIRLHALAEVIHPYPTQSEAIRELGDERLLARVSPLLRFLVRAWLAVRR